MAATEDIRPLLKDVLGDFAHELTALLTDHGEADLAPRCLISVFSEDAAVVMNSVRQSTRRRVPKEAGDRSIRTYPLIQSKVFWFLTSSTKKSSVSKFFIVMT
jgi:hypothetical protein